MGSFINAIPGAIGQGLIWGIMAIGVYITFRVLDFADLTVDGTLATGGATLVTAMMNGVNVYVALVIAFAAGCLAGLVTGLLNTVFGIPFGRYLNTAGAVFNQPAYFGQGKSACVVIQVSFDLHNVRA